MLMIKSYDGMLVEKKLDGYQLVINIGSDDCFYKTPESMDGALMDILKSPKKNPEEYEDCKSYKWRYDEACRRIKEAEDIIRNLHDIIDIYEIAFEGLKYDRGHSDERLAWSARSAIDYVECQLKKNGKD